jgi:hypothetical protein
MGTISEGKEDTIAPVARAETDSMEDTGEKTTLTQDEYHLAKLGYAGFPSLLLPYSNTFESLNATLNVSGYLRH